MSKVHIGKLQPATGRLGPSHADPGQTGTVTTKVPARLDRLPWSRWHWMIIIGLGTAAGGITAPLLFSKLVSTGKVPDTALAFVIGASLMILAGLVEIILGVRAEQKGLEDIAQPLTAEEAAGGRGAG
jgi:hypothetical protein